MSEDNYPDLEKICRLCLQEVDPESLCDIFPKDLEDDCTEVQLSIPLRIMACASLEVRSCDGLPKMICNSCRYQLEKSYYFRKRCQLSDSKLRKHIRSLSFGRKSRVFSKSDDDEFGEESEFEQSLQFIQQEDESLEKKRNAESNEKLQGELQRKLSVAKKEWKKECKHALRDEVAAELRPIVVEEVKKSLKSELESELRDILREELREEERQELLCDLEAYLKTRREAAENTNGNTKHTSSERTLKSSEVSSHRASNELVSAALKRAACSCSINNAWQKHLKCRSVTSSCVASSDAVQGVEISGESGAPPVSHPFEAITVIKRQDNFDDPEAEHEFFIVESDGNNDEAEESTDQPSESRDSSAGAEYCKEEEGSENFRLDASEKTDQSPSHEAGSYRIESSGEINYYKKSEESPMEEDGSNEEEGECEGDVIVFNFEEGLESDQMDTMQIMSLAKKIIVVEPNENAENPSKVSTKESKPLFTKSIESTGNALPASTTFSETVHARATDTPKTFKCNLCPMAFSTENSLNRHMRTHRKMEQRGVSYQCPECLIYLSCKSALNRHMVIHTGERPHVCEECGKSFVQREILKRHMQTHSGVKQHKCPHCVRTFAQKNSLTHHINRLHAEVPVEQQFPCHLCPKRFNHASGLSRHLGTHTGLTFQCTKCKRKFADRSSIKRHIANVHGEGKSALIKAEESQGGNKHDDADFAM